MSDNKQESPDRLMRQMLKALHAAYLADLRYDLKRREENVVDVSRNGHTLLAMLENGGYAPNIRAVCAAFLKESKGEIDDG